MSKQDVRSVVLPPSGYHAIAAHVHSGDDIALCSRSLTLEGTVLFVPGVTIDELMFVEAEPAEDGG